MGRSGGRVQAFLNNRWAVFVAAIWMQSCAGCGYLFGSLSPIIKSSLCYNQRQIASLGVAKDLGGSLGFMAGSLCEVLPLWGALLVGAVQNSVGYGWVWLIVTGRAPPLPLWSMWILIFIGSNGETYFNTAALVSCVQNFPKSRGPVVGILKGFAGLSGAIMIQVYAIIHAPDHAAMLFMVAVGPSMVVIALMFIIRPVEGHRQVRSSDSYGFTFIYSVCLILAAYLMGVMLLEDLADLNGTVIMLFTVLLFVLLFLPILIPLQTFNSDPSFPVEEHLLPEPQQEDAGKSGQSTDANDVVLSEVEADKSQEVYLLPVLERKGQIDQLQAKLLEAATEGAVRVKGGRGPHRGKNFTLMQTLINADFWLLFISLLLGSGSGLTVIDNLGQMSESLGYDEPHIFVSMISIWNFLGRVGGGYFSEIVVRDHAYPRPVATVIALVVMAIGHFFLAMAWPGAMYIVTLLIGLGYGAHWAIVPAAASELFGLKNFGALYNFLTAANPAGSLLFSGLIASSIYDYEAEKQTHKHWNSVALFRWFFNGTRHTGEPLKCKGAMCFFLTSLIMAGFCIIALILNIILVYRTKTVYSQLYGRPQR